MSPGRTGRLFAGDGGLPLRHQLSDLTPREREVLHLLAAGLSNREIAEALVVSVRTVGRHVDNIYGKLGVHDRRLVRQWVRDDRPLTDGPATTR